MRRVYRSSLPQNIQNSLSACWKEGVVAQVMISIFDYYLIPYALFIGATTQQVGLLVAIPQLMSSLSQFLAVHAVGIVGTRKNVLLYGVGSQAILLIPVALLSFLPVPTAFKVVLLIIFMTFYRSLGSIIGPAWGSLVSDYLPEGQRGQYFGWRSRMVSIAGIAGTAFWGSMLSLVKDKAQAAGFAVLFFAAVLFRFVSFYFMNRMANIPVTKAPSSEFTFLMFLKRFRQSNFVRFVFYVTSITFATQLANPYISVMMLKNLHFNYISYMSVHLASVVASLIAFPLWGRHADVVGNARVLKSTALMLPFVPFLWMFARSPWELVLIEMFSGFVYSGFGLATSNFIYDSVEPANRVRAIGYYNVINSGAIFAGAWLGGYLAEHLPPLLGYPIVTLFLISGLARFGADFLLSKHFEEVRVVKQAVSSAQLFLSVLGIRPIVADTTEPEVYPPIRPPRKQYEERSEAKGR